MIKEIHIKELTFAEYNPRQVHKGAIERLAKSLSSPQGKELFKRRPILANKRDGKLIVYAGNMRLRAAISLGMKEVPVIIDEISLDEEKERNVKDNLVIGEWDDDLLANNFDLEQLEDWGMDLKELGIEPEGEEETDEVPEPPKEALAKLGQLFILGKHRLLCGDSTKAEDVSLLMDGKKAKFVYSDPPYGIQYDGGVGSERDDAYKDDFADYHEFLKKIYKNAFDYSDEKSALMIWYASKKTFDVLNAIKDCGYDLREILIWNKPNAHYGALMCQYKIRYEPCIYAFKHGKSPRWFGDTKQRNLVDVEQPTKNELHPTMKPIKLYTIFIPNHTEQGDIIYEPFCGSGSTLIACEQTNRICFGMEIDPAYCDVIISRYCNYVKCDKEEIYNSAVQVVQERVTV